MLTPVAAKARMPVGMATPYASMLLEAREGGRGCPVRRRSRPASSRPTPISSEYYAANRGRYMVPEQRVVRFARIGPEQVANVAATDQEIEAYYKANQAAYAAKETRDLTQAVVPTRQTANAIAARAKAGAKLAAAATPAGANAAVKSLPDQTRRRMHRWPATRSPPRRSPRRRAQWSARSSPTSAGRSSRSIR